MTNSLRSEVISNPVASSYPIANSEFGDGLYYMKRQLIAVAIGLAGFNLMVHSPLRYLLKTAQLGIFLLLGLLWLTLVPGVGTTINGATSSASVTSCTSRSIGTGDTKTGDRRLSQASTDVIPH